MTSQTYRADDNPMPHEDDQAVRDDDQAVPRDDRAKPESDRAGRDEPVSLTHAAMAAPDSEPAASAASEFPGSTLDSIGADQPGTGDGRLDNVTLPPAAAAAASSAAESPPAGNTTTGAGSWSEIQATFVDDPRASIELAASLVDDRVQALVTSVTNLQHSLRSAWQAGDSGTEELRLALRHYRAFWHRLEDSPLNESSR